MVEGNNQLTLGWNTDTTAPTIAVTRAGTGTLNSGTDTITFTLSEAGADFTLSDVVVTGGTLSNFQQSTGNPLIYTATFTPNGNSQGTASVGVHANAFKDLAGNANADDYILTDTENTNNKVDIAYDTRTGSFSVQNDTATIGEAGGTANGTTGSALASTTSGVANLNVLGNDTLATTVTGVTFNGTSGTLGSALNGQYGTLTLNADGSYTYTVNNSNPTVNALPVGSSLTEVFSYTARDTGNTNTGTANLVITITGANDAPVAVADTAAAVEAGGVGNATTGTNPTGNVLTNDTDVDTGDTKTVSAIHAGSNADSIVSSGTTSSTGTTAAGTYGSIKIGADGSYVYTVDNANATVQALLPTSTALTDTFTYTVKDAAGLTSTNTITVSITGANDAPQVQVALVDQNATTGSAFTYTFPGNANTTADTFKDVDTGHQSTLTYAATLADGSSLPSWLSFNATTRTFSGTPPTGTSLSDITVKVTATDSLGLSTTDDFIIHMAAGQDNTPPTIAITSNQASLTAGQTATITFILSEASTTFTDADVTVSGGTLSNFTGSGTTYTATFTPATNSTANGVIYVDSTKFTDAAGNNNADGTDANNTVTLNVNTTVASSLNLVNDTATAVESGVTSGNTAVAGTNPSATTQAAGVLGNDTAATSVTQIALSGGSNSAVSSGSTGASNGTSVTGQYGTLVMGADGTYTYTLNNANATVNALQVGSSLTEVFTYTATDGTTNKTANLTVTITGTNDAPVAVVDTASAVEAGGTANGTAGTNPTGDVLTNDTDVDLADTRTVSAIHTGSATGTTGDSVVAAGTPTSKAGTYGTISINADGSYTYAVDNTNAAVQALLPSSAALTDTFTYTVRDVTGATSQATITVSVTGANDAPQVQVALVDTTATTGTAFSYTFAGNANTGTDTFKDVDTGHQSTLTYAATLADGSSLPSWLSFNATTRTFSGTPPVGTTPGNITVKVTATDSLGLSTNDDFIIALAAAPAGDTTPPTILIERANPAASLDAVGTETIIFTLSEASATFDGSDIAVTGGTLSGFTPVASSGSAAAGYTKYTAVFTPTANSTGTATIGVASGKFADMAGNLNQDTYLSPAPTGATTELAANNTNQVSVGYDTRSTNPADNDKPTIQVSIDKASLATGQTATLTFILSEPSADFTLADINVFGGNGTVTNLVPVAGSNGVQYTATYTAGSTAGTDKIGVDSSKFSDAAGNQNADTWKDTTATGTATPANSTYEANNWVQLTNTGASDTTAPTVVVTRMGSGTVGSAGETIVFTLSEPSSNFISSDVDVVGGTLTNWTAVSATQYTATFVPTAGSNGTATIGVAAGKFTDGTNANADTYVTGTGYEANNQVVLGYDTRTNPAPTDTTAPTIAITASKTTLATSETATITFTLSEASTDFAPADVAVTGGTLSNWTQVNATTYTATYTPTAGSQSTGSVHVDSNAFRDAASNYNQDGAEANNTVNFITNNGVAPADNTPPTIAITSNQASLSAGQTAVITFTFSEAITGFVWDPANPSASTNDIEVTGGTLGQLTQDVNNPLLYTAVFTPTANSTAAGVIRIAAGKFQDTANNLNLDTYDTNSADYQDNNTVTLSVNTTSSSTMALFNDTAEAIESGVSISGGVSTAVTGTNPTGNVLGNDTSATGGLTKIKLATSSSDSNVSASSTSASNGTSVVGQYGTLVIGADGSYTYTVNNSNATVQGLRTTSETLNEVFTYTATDGSTTKTANLTITIQGTDDAPTVAVPLADQTGTTTSVLTYTFDSATFADVDAGDTKTYTVSAVNSATQTINLQTDLGITFNPSTRTFSGTPTTTGTYTVTVTCTDAAGAKVSDSFDITIAAGQDSTPPTIAITGPSGAVSAATTVTFTLSEASSDFDLGDIAISGGGTLTNLVQDSNNPLVYTATYTPPATAGTGTATISVASNKFSDAAGNANADGGDANNTLSLSYDTVTPTVVSAVPPATCWAPAARHSPPRPSPSPCPKPAVTSM